MDIGLSRSVDGGETWSKPHPIMDMGEHRGLPQSQNGCSDANILVNTKTGEILVSALWSHGLSGTHQWCGNESGPSYSLEASSQFMMVRSNDDGKTSSKPKNWTRRVKKPQWFLFAPAAGYGITTSSGILVIPSQGRYQRVILTRTLCGVVIKAKYGPFPKKLEQTLRNLRLWN